MNGLTNTKFEAKLKVDGSGSTYGGTHDTDNRSSKEYNNRRGTFESQTTAGNSQNSHKTAGGRSNAQGGRTETFSQTSAEGGTAHAGQAHGGKVNVTIAGPSTTTVVMSAVGLTLLFLIVTAIAVICARSFYRDQRLSFKSRKDKRAAKKREAAGVETGDLTKALNNPPLGSLDRLPPLQITKPEPAPHRHPMTLLQSLTPMSPPTQEHKTYDQDLQASAPSAPPMPTAGKTTRCSRRHVSSDSSPSPVARRRERSRGHRRHRDSGHRQDQYFRSSTLDLTRSAQSSHSPKFIPDQSTVALRSLPETQGTLADQNASFSKSSTYLIPQHLAGWRTQEQLPLQPIQPVFSQRLDESTAHQLSNLSTELQSQRMTLERLLRSTEAMSTKSVSQGWTSRWNRPPERPETGDTTKEVTPPPTQQSDRRTNEEDKDNN